jgi:hypothetical protein
VRSEEAKRSKPFHGYWLARYVHAALIRAEQSRGVITWKAEDPAPKTNPFGKSCRVSAEASLVATPTMTAKEKSGSRRSTAKLSGAMIGDAPIQATASFLSSVSCC